MAKSKTALDFMIERKEIVRQSQEAMDKKEYQRSLELDRQAAILLGQAMELGGLDGDDSYGLMGS
jgi:hypothetical protein